jgi:hypothetical protein
MGELPPHLATDISDDTGLGVDWNPVGPPAFPDDTKTKDRWRVPTVETAGTLSPCFRGLRCWVSGVLQRQSVISMAVVSGLLKTTL